MRSESAIILLDGATRQTVAATLIQETDITEIQDADALWQTFLITAIQSALRGGVLPSNLPEHKF